jgi:hypothetical protein
MLIITKLRTIDTVESPTGKETYQFGTPEYSIVRRTPDEFEVICRRTMGSLVIPRSYVAFWKEAMSENTAEAKDPQGEVDRADQPARSGKKSKKLS